VPAAAHLLVVVGVGVGALVAGVGVGVAVRRAVVVGAGGVVAGDVVAD
jgi:hypothetical protein